VSPPRVRACIVSYRSGERAVRACRSARESGAEVVLVDNSPGGADAGLVSKEVPDAVAIAAPRNLGFAAGSNRAADGAETDYLLFLNPDAALEPGALDALVALLDGDPDTGIAGPALAFPDGRRQPSVRRDPDAPSILHQYTAWKFLFLFRRAYRRYRAPVVTSDEAVPVPVLMGSALLVRASLFRSLGGFDERYFMYYEEADLCRRARDTGASVVFEPSARAVHEGGASASLETAKLAAVRLVSAQRYLRRFLTPGRYALFRAAFLPGFPIRAMYDLVRDLFYLLVFAIVPGKRRRLPRKAREALAQVRLLSVDLFKVAAA